MSTVLEAPPPAEPAPAVATHTADDLLHMPDGERYELVDGQLEERDMGALSGWVGNRVGSELDRYAQQNGGWAFGDGVGYRCFSPDQNRIRRPDASYVQAGRMETPPSGFITVPPDLVVEVVSPSDAYYHVEKKIDEYLSAGVPLIWVVNPGNLTVRAIRPRRVVHEFRTDDELKDDEVLPGFACSVRSLFPANLQPFEFGGSDDESDE